MMARPRRQSAHQRDRRIQNSRSDRRKHGRRMPVRRSTASCWRRATASRIRFLRSRNPASAAVTHRNIDVNTGAKIPPGARIFKCSPSIWRMKVWNHREASGNNEILNEARWEIVRSVAWNLGQEAPSKSNPKAVLDYLQSKVSPVYDT